jgi:hypothetical protein
MHTRLDGFLSAEHAVVRNQCWLRTRPRSGRARSGPVSISLNYRRARWHPAHARGREPSQRGRQRLCINRERWECVLDIQRAPPPLCLSRFRPFSSPNRIHATWPGATASAISPFSGSPMRPDVSPASPEDEQPSIGLIGMGAMGKMYASCLSKAGWKKCALGPWPAATPMLIVDQDLRLRSPVKIRRAEARMARYVLA